MVLTEIGGGNESGAIHQMLDGEEGEGVEGEGEGEGELQREKAQEQVPKKLQGSMSRPPGQLTGGGAKRRRTTSWKYR